MPHASRTSAPQSVSIDGFEGRYADMPGGYTAGFETYTADADVSQFFRGLPDDRCQCPHWGYVRAGKVTFRYADRDETYEAGDAYYAPAGHTPVFYAGTELVELSPTDALGETMTTVLEN